MEEQHLEALGIDVTGSGPVSALLLKPARPMACFVFAHGAGAGMTHPFMECVATGLVKRDIATLRYQFPYMERRARRPDPPAIAHNTVRAAVTSAAHHMPSTPLIAGGKSFGGRMTSQSQAISPLPDVRGLCFFGFPLHPAGKPSDERAKHLSEIQIPMLFLQGAKDKLAELELLEPVIQSLGRRVTLHLVPHSDHSFHVPARSGKSDFDVMNEMLDAFANWIRVILANR